MNLADQTLYENHSKGEMVLAEYDAFLEWTYKKGLLCAEDYYYFANPICPETKESEEDYLEGDRRWLEGLLDEKQYFYLAHPAYPCDEALLMYNDDIPKGAMLLERKMEYQQTLMSPRTLTGRGLQYMLTEN